MPAHLDARLVSNWTTAAGALQGILEAMDLPLPRHAVMGLTAHAWHFCLQTKGAVTALPGGPHDMDWEEMVGRYSRLGMAFERFGARQAESAAWDITRNEAVEWAADRIAAGVPVAGFDFHLHEFGVVYAVDRERKGFLVDSVIAGEVGPFASWADWPSSVGMIELFAPVGVIDADPDEALEGALRDMLRAFAGEDGPAGESPRGTAGLEAWADAMDGEGEVDRAGNAYTLAVLQAARLDGADFLSAIAEALPDHADALALAERAIRDETQALAPLTTLFPFPSGGHGNVNNAGLRQAAAMALRRAAGHERRAAEVIRDLLDG